MVLFIAFLYLILPKMQYQYKNILAFGVYGTQVYGRTSNNTLIAVQANVQ